MKTKIKNRVSVSKNTDGTYSVVSMTFCNGNTVNHQVWKLNSRAEALSLKNYLENL